MNNIVSEKMLQIVKDIKERASEAESEYEYSAEKFQMKASRSIDLFGGDAVSRVADIASEARRICDKLYASYQTLVKILDEQCRPLLDHEPDYKAVGEVKDLIKWLNDESEIESNASVSFNSYGLGDVASGRYIPSIENKMIQSFWETKYRMWPGRVEAEEAEKLRKQQEEERKKKALEEKHKKAEEEKRRKEEEEQRALEEQDRVNDEQAKTQYEKELKEWEEENFLRKVAIQQLEGNVEKQAQQIEKLCEEKLKIEQTRIDNEKYCFRNQMEEIKREISNDQDELKKLGIFKISEKNRLKGKIHNLEKEYDSLKDSCSAIDVEYAKRCNELTLEANRIRGEFYCQPEALQYLVYTTIKKSENSMSYDGVISVLSQIDSPEVKDKCFDTIQELVNKKILNVETKSGNGLNKEKFYYVATEKKKPVLILPSVVRKETERKRKEEEDRKRKQKEAEARRIAEERERMKQMVYYAIFYDSTVQDVARELCINDSWEVASYIKELLEEGKIEKTVRNGRSYFSRK